MNYYLLLAVFVRVTGLHTQTNKQTNQPSERTFYGLSRDELIQLHDQHINELNHLYNQTYGGGGGVHLLQSSWHFPWHIPVNITCPELDWTFKYEEPFLHMSLPVCGNVIQPQMFLYHGNSSCELDPAYLPNNQTTNCTQNMLTDKVDEIVVITHGFLKSISSSWMHDMGVALMNKSDTTAILLVGWGHGSGGSPIPDPFYYYQAAANTRYMGVAVAKMLINIVDDVNLATNSIDHAFSFHCIGHSLGAHICGFLGKNLQNLTHFSLRRISGLDPAGPLFASDVPFPFNFINISEDARLNKADAHFVDVIHTDGRARFTFEVVPQYGTMLELGHVDFYPGSDGEFGWNQPGCWQVGDIGSCSHSRSHDYYLSSLTVPCPALQSCSNTTVIPSDCSNITYINKPNMGYWVDKESFPGDAFTVLTNASAPFCTN